MPRIATIKPRIAKLAPRLRQEDRDTQRAADQPWRRWYFTARWQKLRESIRLRDKYTCGICRLICAGRGQAVVDHRMPHRGDEALFWDAANLWCLCKGCHDSVKQRDERSEAGRRW